MFTIKWLRYDQAQDSTDSKYLCENTSFFYVFPSGLTGLSAFLYFLTMFVFFRLTLINWGDGPLAGARLQGRPGPGLAWPRTPEAAEVPSPGPSSESEFSERQRVRGHTEVRPVSGDLALWLTAGWPRRGRGRPRSSSSSSSRRPSCVGGRMRIVSFNYGRTEINIVKSEMLNHLSSLIFSRAMLGNTFDCDCQFSQACRPG